MRSKLNNFCCLLLCSFFLSAQNINHDLEKINALFLHAPQFSMKVEYILYEDHSTSKVYKKETADIKRNKEERYMQIGELENISTATYNLMVDHESKVITLLPPVKTFPVNVTVVNIDSLKGVCEKYYFKKQDQQYGAYWFELNEYSEYEKVMLNFNLETYLINKIVLFIREEDISEDESAEKVASPRMEIIYKEFNKGLKKQEMADFSLDKFLKKKGNNFILNEAYAGYVFNNYLQKK